MFPAIDRLNRVKMILAAILRMHLLLTWRLKFFETCFIAVKDGHYDFHARKEPSCRIWQDLKTSVSGLIHLRLKWNLSERLDKVDIYLRSGRYNM